jgi:hypothetical protein
LKDSLESIGNEMMALHEPRRIVEYHDRSAKPFWLAVVPPHSSSEALTRIGIPSGDRCTPSDLTIVAIGGTAPLRCVTLPRPATANLRVVHKQGHETVQMILDLDANGYRIVDLQ